MPLNTGFSLSIGVAGEYCKATEGLLWKGNLLSLETSKI